VAWQREPNRRWPATIPWSFDDRTSISAAIDFAVILFDRAPHASDPRVVDISGDGNSNAGRHVVDAVTRP
jgi:Protein of unknown function (DUF1194)